MKKIMIAITMLFLSNNLEAGCTLYKDSMNLKVHNMEIQTIVIL